MNEYEIIIKEQQKEIERLRDKPWNKVKAIIMQGKDEQLYQMPILNTQKSLDGMIIFIADPRA